MRVRYYWEDISMDKKLADSSNVCDRCGEQLKSIACGDCNGKGYYRERVFFKKECEACSGSGRVLRCPHAYQHINVTLRKTPMGAKTPVRTNELSRPQIPPPWHPSHPNPWHPVLAPNQYLKVDLCCPAVGAAYLQG